MSRKQRPINLPAPYLKRIWLDEARVTDRTAYPFCLPLFRSGFAFDFEKPITIIVSENGTGKSTRLHGLQYAIPQRPPPSDAGGQALDRVCD